jgi:dTDP-glucose 4,6-dehydratase
MNLLITGGAGFIGSHFIKAQLAKSWDKITIVDALTYAGNLDNLQHILNDTRTEFIHGDICDEGLLGRAFVNVDVVVNFAAESHVDRSISSSSDFIKTNVLGTQNLLEISKKCGIKTFLQVSTDEVYGSISEGSWTENSPLDPNSPYSASKASADLLCLAFAKTHGMDVRVTRCSNNYGSHQHPEKLIPKAITNMIEGLPIPVYGDGRNSRDWLHVTDHCYGIELALKYGKPGEVFNIGGGIELTNLELIEMLFALSPDTQNSIEFVQDRKGHDRRYSVSSSKLEEIAGYSPMVTLKKGLKETFAWYEENETWWKPLKGKIA